MLKNDDNNVDNIIKKGYLIENKTHFRTNKLCFKCFANELTTRDLDNINTLIDYINQYKALANNT